MHSIHILNIEIMTKNTKLKIDSTEYINSSSNTRHTERDGLKEMESTVKEWLKSIFQESDSGPQPKRMKFSEVSKFNNSLLGNLLLLTKSQELFKKHFQTQKARLAERQGTNIYWDWNGGVVQVLQQNLTLVEMIF